MMIDTPLPEPVRAHQQDVAIVRRPDQFAAHGAAEDEADIAQHPCRFNAFSDAQQAVPKAVVEGRQRRRASTAINTTTPMRIISLSFSCMCLYPFRVEELKSGNIRHRAVKPGEASFNQPAITLRLMCLARRWRRGVR